MMYLCDLLFTYPNTSNHLNKSYRCRWLMRCYVISFDNSCSLLRFHIFLPFISNITSKLQSLLVLKCIFSIKAQFGHLACFTKQDSHKYLLSSFYLDLSLAPKLTTIKRSVCVQLCNNEILQCFIYNGSCWIQ